MVNAWSLLGSIVNGTFEEDYPLMDKSKGGWSEEDEIRELDDYYDFMVAYYRTSEYYECKEIKSIRDRVDAITFKEKEKVAKKKASQPIPEW